eukprot:10324809-Alexandrium_andersonii.AAC.1
MLLGWSLTALADPRTVVRKAWAEAARTCPCPSIRIPQVLCLSGSMTTAHDGSAAEARAGEGNTVPSAVANQLVTDTDA